MSLIAELRRRNVFRVAAVYVVACWLILQAADIILPALGLPDWTITFLLAIMGLGFPLALVFAWAFELTPDGVHRTETVPLEQSITRETGRRLDRTIIVVLAVAVALLLVDRFLIGPPASESADEAEVAAVAKSIAVLPFTNMSDDASNEYFSDGIAEEILHLLARVEGLRVSSRTSAFALKGQQLDLPTIAERLKVDHVLEGSVRRSGDRVRITAQLIDVATDSHLWAQSYERELEDLFAIQTEISRSIVDALEVALGTRAEQALSASAPITNLQAYEIYLQGRYLLDRRGEGPIRQAIERFEEAIELDSGFAQAYSSLAAAQLTLMTYAGARPSEVVPAAQRAADRALALDDASADAYVVLGDLARLRAGGWLESEQHYQRALEIEPSSPLAHLWYSEMLGNVGRIGDALEHAQTALELDPLNPGAISMVAVFSYLTGDLDTAETYARRASDLGHPNIAGLMTPIRAERGDWDLVEHDLMQVARNQNEPLELAQAALAALQDPSRVPETRKLLLALEESGAISPQSTALWITIYEDWELAYDRVEVTDENRIGITNTIWDPRFDRQDPRFPALLDELALPEYFAVAGPPDLCRFDGDDLICD